MVLVLLVLFPASLAYRGGATNESCYAQEVRHSAGIPLAPNAECTGRCLVDFRMVGEVDITNLDQVNNFTGTLTCGSVYRSKFCMCMPIDNDMPRVTAFSLSLSLSLPPLFQLRCLP